MAFNGSGTFVRLYNWVTDRNNSVKIRADRMDADMDGFATGLSNAICRDGQSTVTANIPFNGYLPTGLGTASAGDHALSRAAADARFQAIDADLTALAGLAATGLISRTGSGTVAARTITQPAAGIVVTNGDGVSGNPTLALANDLAAVEAISGAGFVVRTTTDTWATRQIANGTGTTVTNGTAVSGDPAVNVTYATQAQMEAATATDVAVNPARQHHHPSSPKAWAGVTMSGTTPVLQQSYNVTSITDSGVGFLTITLDTDFAAATYCAVLGIEQTSGGICCNINTQAVGAVTCYSSQANASPVTLIDPDGWHFVAFGDHA